MGKTIIALRLAKLLDGEVVGADARQIYDAFPILTAAPDSKTRSMVPHHLVQCLPPNQGISVFDYMEMARVVIDEIITRRRRPIIVGGTGLYLQALALGLAPAPPPSPDIRRELSTMSNKELQQKLIATAPAWAARIDLANRRRVERALERAMLGQVTPPDAQWKATPTAEIKAFLLVRNRTSLHSLITQRTAEMFDAEVTEEVAAFGKRPLARPPIGLNEIWAYLDGELSLQDCIGQINMATRKYAKRQMTWFNARPWFRQLDLQELEKNCLDPATHIAELSF